MIDRKTKEKFLEELEKIGNVLHACKKVGIRAPSTVYRWAEKNKTFKKRMGDALAIGRMNIVDIAEGSVVRKAGEGDVKASTFLLTHLSDRYKPIPNEKPYERTFEDLLMEQALKNKAIAEAELERKEKEVRHAEIEEAYKKLPPRSDANVSPSDDPTPWQ